MPIKTLCALGSHDRAKDDTEFPLGKKYVCRDCVKRLGLVIGAGLSMSSKSGVKIPMNGKGASSIGLNKEIHRELHGNVIQARGRRGKRGH